MRHSIRVAALAAVAACLAIPALADEVMSARSASAGTKVSFVLPAGYFNATLSVAGPDGRVLTASAKQGSPVIDISGQNAMGDGVYTYQITAASPKTKAVKADGADGRDIPASQVNMRGEMSVHVPAAMSGSFLVKGGRIVDTSNMTEGTAR
ncbi:hypothetical protein [Mesorhizobium sp. J428]|uniref:hypothetical protein n=1 Tax=Mesorhizobium sp. J428 TaxID=2898440 RepID=UPI002150EB15|nr:hypothetical protein [Mesorhizobium sp. J428]MCR5859574.1 hypothetical protein [Mesorhizobium sp. J428]